MLWFESSTVWDPYTKSNINKLESVQRRAARYVLDDYQTTSSVTAMLQQLGWESLQYRREIAKTVMMFKITQSLVVIPSTPYLHPVGATTRGHHHRLQISYARTDTYKGSFFPSGIRLWNALPPEATGAKSLDTFKSGLVRVL